MSLYAEYIKEREGRETIEDDKGFLNYSLLPDFFYFGDIYVKPEYREQGHAKILCDKAVEVARNLGYKKILSTIVPKTNGATKMLLIHIRYGFELDSADDKAIYFIKNI